MNLQLQRTRLFAERANFFVHFVGWGGEKRRLAPGGILGLVADFWTDSDLCSLVSFCCLCRDLGVFLILILWGFLREFGKETPFRRLLEGVVEARDGEFLGNLEAGFSHFWRSWGVSGGRMGKSGDFGAENVLAFGSKLFGVWSEMHLRLRENVLAFWGVWVLRGVCADSGWIWMAVWVDVFSSWWCLMDCFELSF